MVFSLGTFHLLRKDFYVTIWVNGLGFDPLIRKLSMDQSRNTGKYVYAFSGEPWFCDGIAYYPASHDKIAEVAEQSWAQCPICGEILIARHSDPFDSHYDCPEGEALAKERGFKWRDLLCSRMISWKVVSPAIAIAFCAARLDLNDKHFTESFESLRNSVEMLLDAGIYASKLVEMQWQEQLSSASKTNVLRERKESRFRAYNPVIVQ